MVQVMAGNQILGNFNIVAFKKPKKARRKRHYFLPSKDLFSCKTCREMPNAKIHMSLVSAPLGKKHRMIFLR